MWERGRRGQPFLYEIFLPSQQPWRRRRVQGGWMARVEWASLVAQRCSLRLKGGGGGDTGVGRRGGGGGISMEEG
jgi:hypothetical protein